MMQPGPRNLITDVPGCRVGNARDDRLKSGVTVLTGDAPFTASCAVQGGAPGTRETDLLAPEMSVPAVDALVLSGGSRLWSRRGLGGDGGAAGDGARLCRGAGAGAAGAGGDPVRPAERR